MTVETGPFRRADRLLRREEFQRLERRGEAARVQGFILFAAARSGGDQTRQVRLGMTVSRRVGTAVVRNRVKRWIREWFRGERARMQSGLDLLVVARQPAGRLSHGEARRALEAGARAVGVLV